MNNADKDSLINKTPQVTFDSDEEEQESKTTVKAVVEPLERGYGHTLGTGMRRMLLSSIPGLLSLTFASKAWSTNTAR